MKWIKELKMAIAGHRKIEIIYNGALREVAPHILGTSSTGHMLLSTFQFYHSLDATKNNQWRTFSVDKIEKVAILPDRFHPRYDYNPGDHNFHEILNQI